MTDGLSIAQDGAVLRVTLDRPQTRNAQDPAMWAALARVGETLDPAVRVIVVAGAGASFSSGLDRRLLDPAAPDGIAAIAASGADAARAFIADAQRAFAWLPACDAVSVAAVRGHAIGAGFQLVLACDVVVAADDASFAMRETSWGIVPDLGGTHPLVRALGPGRALELCATGRAMGAEEALRTGIAAHVVPGGGLEAAVDALVGAVLSAPDGAVRELKGLLRNAVAATPADQRIAEQDAQLRRFASLLGQA